MGAVSRRLLLHDTYDSVRQLREANPDAELTLLMGSDQYAKRETWHRWADLEKLCDIAIVARPGWILDSKVKAIPMIPMPISASEIRARVARGEDVSAMLPAPVLAYIRQHGLYR